MRLFALILTCSLTVTTLSIHSLQLLPGIHAASLISMIPGADMLRDLSIATMDTINNSIDQVLDSTINLKGQFLTDFTHVRPDSKDPDTGRNVTEIIRSRGFEAEEYDVVTKDGYILTIQRIINPLIDPEQRAKMKPVILQHGLMSSSVDWVINSFNVRPAPYPTKKDSLERPKRDTNGNDDVENSSSISVQRDPDFDLHDSQDHPNALGFYLANQGYDVFLANSRGNIYGQRHISMNSWEPKFWDFTFDEQIEYDLPDTIEFVQRLTNQQKIGYVGHSQGTLMMFGLLSEKPDYADIVEPFVALAPVAYCNHAITPARYFAVYTPIFQHINMWFANSNFAVRHLGPIVCGPEIVRKDICSNIIFLATGFNEEELDTSRVSAYLSHMPSGTSVKNIAHYGQEVISGRFAKFDHGILANRIKYKQNRPPDYRLDQIRSKSIALFIAENDWLASPKDVARLRADLQVEPVAVVNVTEYMPKWNHIDFLYGKHAGELINTRILKIFEQFRQSPEE